MSILVKDNFLPQTVVVLENCNNSKGIEAICSDMLGIYVGQDKVAVVFDGCIGI